MWTTKDLWNADYAYGVYGINCIIYADGYWVVGGQYHDGSAYCARIAYVTSLDGTWATKDLWADGDNNQVGIQVNSITYADGYWVAGGRYYGNSTYYAHISYAGNLSDFITE